MGYRGPARRRARRPDRRSAHRLLLAGWARSAPHHEEGLEPARASFPPGAATQIVRVLTQLTLPHTRLPIYTQEVVPP